MSAYNNLTFLNGTQNGYTDAKKLAVSTGKTYAFKETAGAVPYNVEAKQISAAEAGIQSVNRDRFEKSEFNPRHDISNLFGAYSGNCLM